MLTQIELLQRLGEYADAISKLNQIAFRRRMTYEANLRSPKREHLYRRWRHAMSVLRSEYAESVWYADEHGLKRLHKPEELGAEDID